MCGNNRKNNFYIKTSSIMSSFIASMILTGSLIPNLYFDILVSIIFSMVIYIAGERAKENG